MLPSNICFEVKLIRYDAPDKESWLDELSSLRAEAFYAHGERPAFKLKNDQFFDPDPFDRKSYHILAYDMQKQIKQLIGAVRLLPLFAPNYACVAAEITGKDHFKKMLNIFPPNTKLMEVNRFFVVEKYQHQVLGMHLCAAAWKLGHTLGYHLITNGNIRLVEALYTKHLGGVLFPELAGPYHSKLYNDQEIYILYIDKKRASSYLLQLVEEQENWFLSQNLSQGRLEKVKKSSKQPEV